MPFMVKVSGNGFLYVLSIADLRINATFKTTKYNIASPCFSFISHYFVIKIVTSFGNSNLFGIDNDIFYVATNTFKKFTVDII